MSKINPERRVITAGLLSSWSAPMIISVALPAHAQTSLETQTVSRNQRVLIGVERTITHPVGNSSAIIELPKFVALEGQSLTSVLVDGRHISTTFEQQINNISDIRKSVRGSTSTEIRMVVGGQENRLFEASFDSQLPVCPSTRTTCSLSSVGNGSYGLQFEDALDMFFGEGKFQVNLDITNESEFLLPANSDGLTLEESSLETVFYVRVIYSYFGPEDQREDSDELGNVFGSNGFISSSCPSQDSNDSGSSGSGSGSSNTAVGTGSGDSAVDQTTVVDIDQTSVVDGELENNSEEDQDNSDGGGG